MKDRYEEALERTKTDDVVYDAIRKVCHTDDPEKFAEMNETVFMVAKEAVVSLFPELRESKDEKIRKWLIKTLKGLCNSPVEIDGSYEMMLPAIAWLEKQKGQKPAEIDERKIINKHITEDSLSSEVNKRLKECGWYVTDEKPAEWSKDWREEDIQTRFAFYTYKDDSSELYLSNVFVEETSRNHGFGTRILRAAEKVAETIGATTICLKVKQDSPANAWYRERGYGYVAFEDGYDWLEKNLEYMKPTKQEWSEEDKTIIDCAV